MNNYYGTKKLAAKPMSLGVYNAYRGWDIPEDEDPQAKGYLVEYLDGGKSNHEDHAGYISWSPKDVFEAAYQPTTAMSFGHAIQAMKEGHKVARAGWNGKGMWVALTSGSLFEAKYAKDGHAAKHRAYEVDEINEANPDGLVQIRLLPHFDMRAADGSIVVGWLASQSDMLAKDWMIV